jgi:hypothetical protein
MLGLKSEELAYSRFLKNKLNFKNELDPELLELLLLNISIGGYPMPQVFLESSSIMNETSSNWNYGKNKGNYVLEVMNNNQKYFLDLILYLPSFTVAPELFSLFDINDDVVKRAYLINNIKIRSNNYVEDYEQNSGMSDSEYFKSMANQAYRDVFLEGDPENYWNID